MRPGAAWRFLKLPCKIQKNQTKMHQFDFCCAATTNRASPPRPRGPGPACPRVLACRRGPIAFALAWVTLHPRGPHMRGQGSELSPPDATNARDHSLRGHIRRRRHSTAAISARRRASRRWPARPRPAASPPGRPALPSGGAPHRPFRVPALRHLCRGLALPDSDGACRSRQGGTTSDREQRSRSANVLISSAWRWQQATASVRERRTRSVVVLISSVWRWRQGVTERGIAAGSEAATVSNRERESCTSITRA